MYYSRVGHHIRSACVQQTIVERGFALLGLVIGRRSVKHEDGSGLALSSLTSSASCGAGVVTPGVVFGLGPRRVIPWRGNTGTATLQKVNNARDLDAITTLILVSPMDYSRFAQHAYNKQSPSKRRTNRKSVGRVFTFTLLELLIDRLLVAAPAHEW